MEKLKYTKFKTLLISSFICISIIPVVLLGLFIFHLSKQELIRQSEKQMWQNAENVSDILDEKLDYIEEFSLKINVDTRIYKIFQNLDTSDSMQLESASQEISKILLDYLPWNNTVYSTHIVTPYYQFGEKEKNYYPNYSFMGSKIQKAADEANGKLVWIPAYNYMDMFSIEDMPRDFLEYEHVFTAVRKLQLSRVESGHIEHLENKTDQMYLVVNFTEDNLNNMLKKYTKANSQILYYIMSEDGSVVGPYGENESKLFRNVTAADMGITENKGTVKYYGANNQEYIVTYSKSMVTGWYTLAMIPVNVFSKNIATDLTRAILILVTIEIILSVTTAVLISRKIGKKVYKPLHMIEKTGEGNFTARIVYDNTYNKKTRMVSLEGEAYFEVAKDKEKPFIVKANGINVQALGTSFNIRAHKDDKSVAVILISGKVKVDDGRHEAYMKPNERLVCNLTNGQFEKSELHPNASNLLWRSNELALYGESFEEICTMLTRMYNCKFIFKNEKAKQYTYHGIIKNGSLNNVLEYISQAGGINYKIESDNTIIIY